MRIMSICVTEDLYMKLKYVIPSKKISKFISEIISKELDLREQEIIADYKNAELDIERQNLLKEWDDIEGIINE